MKKSIIKKLFIRLSKILGYEIIDQNEFYSPTLERKIDENLSSIDKSIVLPLGEVKLTRKIKSLLIFFRTNTNIEIWDQNRKRLFEYPKAEYALRSLYSLIKSIKYLLNKHSNIEVKLKIIDDKSNEENLSKIKELVSKSNLNIEIINHDNKEHNNVIKKQTSNETFANLSSLLKCFEMGKKDGKDLVFFVEDDYLHFETALEEMISSYERISSQTNRELFICPSDYPFFYMNNEKTSLLIGSKRHWRTINKTLCTLLTSHRFIDKYWINFYNNCLDRHDPFEKYLNELYQKEICISPVKSLSVHFANINSSYGLSPYIDYKSLWEENDYK
ncbi:glycosyltransferase family 2 protein [Candidatus Pelagibacter sp.]|nr:glycosyltransferase family 2 protein [Candidatus Pelagibacter sp.]